MGTDRNVDSRAMATPQPSSDARLAAQAASSTMSAKSRALKFFKEKVGLATPSQKQSPNVWDPRSPRKSCSSTESDKGVAVNINGEVAIIQDLKAKLAAAEHDLLYSHQAIEQKNTEIEKLRHDRQTMNDVYEEARVKGNEQLVRLREELDRLCGRNETLDHEVTIQKRRLKRADDREKTLEASLEKCKTQIFKMQPDDNVSDAEVARKLEELQTAIMDWIDSQMQSTEDYLTDINTESMGLTTRSSIERSFPFGQLELAKRYQESETSLAAMVVFSFLEEKILNPRVAFLGLSDADEAFVARVGKSMSSTATGNGAGVFSAWTATMYKALLNDQAAEKAKIRVISASAAELMQLFRELMGPKRVDFDVERCTALVQQAVRLADLMGCSSTTYRFVDCGIKNPASKMPLTSTSIRRFDVVDVDTQGRIKGDGGAVPDEHGHVGWVLALVTPSLIRVGDGSKPDIELKKAVILVKFREKLRKKQKQKQAKSTDKETTCPEAGLMSESLV